MKILQKDLFSNLKVAQHLIYQFLYKKNRNQVFNLKFLSHHDHQCYSVAEQVKFFKSGIILQGKVNSKSIPFSAPETSQRFFQLDL